MHQIRFRLGLRPRPRSESSHRSPRHHIRILKGPTSKGKEGGGKGENTRREIRGKRKRGRKGKNKGERRGRGKKRRGPQIEISGYATAPSRAPVVQ